MNKPKKISRISNSRKKSEASESMVVATPSFEANVEISYPGELLKLGCIELKRQDFHYIESDVCNRELNEENVKKLISDRNHTKNPEDYPFTEPVVAFWDEKREKLIIKDGQHRARACEILGTKLRYCLIEENYSIFNGKASKGMKWETHELIPSLAKSGLEGYSLLEALHQKYPRYPYSTLAIFFNLEMVKHDRLLRGQEFTISDNYLTSRLNPSGEMTALEVAELRLQMYEQFNEAAGRKDRSKEIIFYLVKAFEHRDFDFDYFLRRTKQNAEAAKNRPEMSKSISTHARARHLLSFYHNENSRLNLFYF